jgi:hypothetical protein
MNEKNKCPECGGWKASDKKFCVTCRLLTNFYQLSRDQIKWVGPEGNPARRNKAIHMNKHSAPDWMWKQ